MLISLYTYIIYVDDLQVWSTSSMIKLWSCVFKSWFRPQVLEPRETRGRKFHHIRRPPWIQLRIRTELPHLPSEKSATPIPQRNRRRQNRQRVREQPLPFRPPPTRRHHFPLGQPPRRHHKYRNRHHRPRTSPNARWLPQLPRFWHVRPPTLENLQRRWTCSGTNVQWRCTQGSCTTRMLNRPSQFLTVQILNKLF